jgi:hypothetical protein
VSVSIYEVAKRFLEATGLIANVTEQDFSNQ